MGRSQDPVSPVWNQHDQTLLYTCYLGALLATGADAGQVQEVLAPFPGTNAPDERMWASGPFVLSDFRALGDGSYQVGGSFVFGTGKLGVAMVAGSMVANSVAKSRARRAAQYAATPRWVPIEQGTLYVSRYGFSMHTPRVLGWDWGSITSANMVDRGAVHVTGDSDSGPISWLLHSDWAELVFVSWALVRHPRHPQLIDGSWLPPGWVQHAQTCNQSPDPAAPGVGPLLGPATT